MKIIDYPGRDKLSKLLARPQQNLALVREQTTVIMDDVAQRGDLALLEFTKKFDGVSLKTLRVTDDEITRASGQLSADLKEAIGCAYKNIHRFHLAAMPQSGRITTQPGVECWWDYRPVERVGLYIPGGSAPLFSTVLMLGVPARLAGCREVVLCTPPQKDGTIHPAILYTAGLCGIKRVYKVGGAQAIAAMALGTSSIPGVDKIFGPGNRYVFAAKQLAQQKGVAIDLPAGPSEVMVLADSNADPRFVAADLLAQAEHGPDAQVILLTTDAVFAAKVIDIAAVQLKSLPRKKIAVMALENGRALICANRAEMLDIVNFYAPEHLILNIEDALGFSKNVQHAGSVFIGPYTPEAAGDYASGTNHTLPTAGFARSYSGVSVESFMKRITFQSVTKMGLTELGAVVMEMAEAEGLRAHAEAVRIRFKNPGGVG